MSISGSNQVSPSVTLTVFCALFALHTGGKFLFNNPSETEKVLENQGYTNIEVSERPTILACGKDYLGNEFNAINSSGKETSGYVCRGLLFKGSTVRFK